MIFKNSRNVADSTKRPFWLLRSRRSHILGLGSTAILDQVSRYEYRLEKYINLVLNYVGYYLKFNKPFIIAKFFQYLLRTVLRICLLLLLQYLFSVNMFTISVYYPPVVKANLSYLMANRILNKQQLKLIHSKLIQPHDSFQSLKSSLETLFRQFKLSQKNIDIMLIMLEELHDEYATTKNRLTNPIWNANFSDTLLRNVIKQDINVPPSMLFYLGVQKEFVNPKIKTRPTKISVLLVYYLILENLFGLLNMYKPEDIRFRVMTFLGTCGLLYITLGYFFVQTGVCEWGPELVLSVHDHFADIVKSTGDHLKDLSQEHYLKIAQASVGHYRALYYILPGTLAFIFGGLLGYLLVDFYRCRTILITKIKLDLGHLTFRRFRVNHLMPFNSLSSMFKMKYYELLCNSCTGCNWYLTLLNNYLLKNTRTQEWLYTITPVYNAQDGATTAVIMTVILNYVFDLNGLFQTLYANITDLESFVQKLEGGYADLENYEILGHDKHMLWLSFILAMNISKTIFISLPQMAVQYLICPMIFYNTVFRPSLFFISTYSYVYYSKIKNPNSTTIKKQKYSITVVTTLMLIIMVVKPLLVDLWCWFFPSYIVFYDLKGRTLKWHLYQPNMNALLVDTVLYYLNDAAFTSLYPVSNLNKLIYTYF